MRHFLLAIGLCTVPAFAADTVAPPPGCPGATPIGKFRLSVSVPWKGGPLPITEVSSIPTGARLIWDPIRLAPHFAQDGEIAALVIPRTDPELMILDPHKAAQQTEWDLPRGAEVIAIVLGVDGLSMNKVKSLVAANEDLLPQLAAYAQQTSQVESLVQALADSEQAGAGADAALNGFSSRWRVAMPKLDAKATPNQQASTLLAALLPSASAYDPLAPAAAQMQQTTSLAASVASLFFGNAVGLAAGGAVLVRNLKSGLFPNTEFRSIYAQSSGAGMTFCAKKEAAKSHTRAAYLWAFKAPDLAMPSERLAGPSYLSLGSKQVLKLKTSEDSTVKQLARAREWRLAPTSGTPSIPVAVTVEAASDSLLLDLIKSKAPAGDYQLAANWDWDTLTLGQVRLRPLGDFSHVKIAPLIQGSGAVSVNLTGADFEFVDKAELLPAGHPKPGAAKPVPFDLPVGSRAGEQTSMTVEIDTPPAGSYKLLLSQSDGAPYAVPLTVLPPNPKLSNLPVRVHAGETEETVRFEGTGLDRLESITCAAGALTGSPDGGAWNGKLRISPHAEPGARFPLLLHVRGLDAPITLGDAIIVVGPRPRILSVSRSVLEDSGVELRQDELPAGSRVGFVLSAEHLGGMHPRLELNCRNAELRKALSISTGESTPGASLSIAGSGSLYLSLDPGQIGDPGCELTATLTIEPNGASDPVVLGHVIAIPVLEKFALTNDASGPNSYAGVLQGGGLEVIEKAGWDPQNGLPIAGIPVPISPTQQTLRLALPWPSPSPHAPLYLWLRGEQTGRRTKLLE